MTMYIKPRVKKKQNTNIIYYYFTSKFFQQLVSYYSYIMYRFYIFSRFYFHYILWKILLFPTICTPFTRSRIIHPIYCHVASNAFFIILTCDKKLGHVTCLGQRMWTKVTVDPFPADTLRAIMFLCCLLALYPLL